MVHISLRDLPESQSNAPALKQSPRATHPDRVKYLAWAFFILDSSAFQVRRLTVTWNQTVTIARDLHSAGAGAARMTGSCAGCHM